MRSEPSVARSYSSDVRSIVLRTLLHNTIPQFAKTELVWSGFGFQNSKPSEPIWFAKFVKKPDDT
ncbi:hypothetical protein RHMOL_Rhmol13G0181700 [Rhododendron molle]|uniref:Uncharacterized protein n=1 Tax=Rhododendron molle TaxID=49168 RepID=A0ACC0L814_RHOML|nr:hypothetical protein RHMOL_Rhmol13G0181700 [Rhododendron molle]